MKNLSLLLIVFLFLQITSLAQSGWVQQTSGTTDNLNSVFFINQSVGWVSGGYDLGSGSTGPIITHTTNGGIDWEEQTLPGGGIISAVCFANDSTGWVSTLRWGPGIIVGGYIFKTTNNNFR